MARLFHYPLAFLVVVIAFVLSAPAEAVRAVTIHIQGGNGPGSRVLVKGVASNGVIVLYEHMTVCTPVVRNLPDGPVVFFVYDADTFQPMHKSWSGAFQPVYQPTASMPSGVCGDGVINGGETCDVRGDVGCGGSTPKCYECWSCGCATEADCPAISPTYGPCGWGRCSATTRPRFRKACAYGACIRPYSCEFHTPCLANCMPPDYMDFPTCRDNCPAPGRCYYDDVSFCWTCRDPVTVTNPCPTADDMNCLLSPSQIPMSLEETTIDDAALVQEEFGFDEEYTEEEGEYLLGVQGELEPPVSVRADAQKDLAWQDVPAFDQWNVYRGDLEFLTNFGEYTQPPGSNPEADQICGVTNPGYSDPGSPVPGGVVFYMVTTTTAGIETSLGFDSGGMERTSTLPPCP